jgi:hypothetical protein
MNVYRDYRTRDYRELSLHLAHRFVIVPTNHISYRLCIFFMTRGNRVINVYRDYRTRDHRAAPKMPFSDGAMMAQFLGQKKRESLATFSECLDNC